MKGAGEKDEAARLVSHPEAKFGQLKQEKGSLEHFGIVHEQSSDGAVTLHQKAYARSLRAINLTKYKFHSSGEAAPQDLIKSYFTLLGGNESMAMYCPAICVHLSDPRRHY